MQFSMDTKSTSPIYQRLADAIRGSIVRGDLKSGEKLPTVRELSAEMGIAGGTIRHAYDLLVREGVLDMAQGKGTFVREQQSGFISREKQAMDAIGTLLDELSALNFSTREMRMFFDLKLSERAPSVILSPILVVDCNAEVLSEIVGQLGTLPGIELTEYLLEDVRRMPVDLLEGYQLMITTQTHYHELCSLFPSYAQKIVRAVLTPSQQTLISIARIEAGGGAGIFCQSARFAEIVRGAIRVCPHLRNLIVPTLLAGEQPLKPFLEDKHTVLVSPDYLSYADSDNQAALRDFAENGGQVIPYHYRIDQGSYLTIEDRVKQITH